MSAWRLAKASLICVVLLSVFWLIAMATTWLGLAYQAKSERNAFEAGSSQLSRSQLNHYDFVGDTAEGGELRSHKDGLEIIPGERGAALGLRLQGAVLDTSSFPQLKLVGGPDRAAITILVSDAVHPGQASATLASETVYLSDGEMVLRWADLSWTLAEPEANASEVNASEANASEANLRQPAPRYVASLRLYVPPGKPVWLRGIEFQSTQGRMPPKVSLSAELPRPESWLQARAKALAAQPGALIVPPGMSRLELPAWGYRTLNIGFGIALVGFLFWRFGRYGATIRSARWIILPLLLPVLTLAIGESWQWWLLIPLAMCIWTSWYLELPASAAGPASRAWYEALLLTAFAMAALLLVHANRPALDLNQFALYVSWAFLQQWLLQTRIYAALRTELSANASAWMAASAFALLHTPNFALMVLSLLGGRLWCWHYERNHRWLPVAVSHAILGLAAMNLLPVSWLLGGEISARFFMM